MHFKKHAVQNTTQVIFYPSNRRKITATSSLLLINSSKNVTVDTVFARNGFFLLHLAVDYLVCFDRTVSPWCQSILVFFLFVLFFYKLLVASERPFLRPAHYCFFLLFFTFKSSQGSHSASWGIINQLTLKSILKHSVDRG